MELQNPLPPNIAKHTHKILYSVIGVLLVVVVAGSYFWWQQVKPACASSSDLPCSGDNAYNQNIDAQHDILRTGTSESSWKTYTNSEYGFEFKYPNDIVVLDHETDESKFKNIYIRRADWQQQERGLIPQIILHFDPKLTPPVTASKLDVKTLKVLSNNKMLGNNSYIYAQTEEAGECDSCTETFVYYILPTDSGSYVLKSPDPKDYSFNLSSEQIDQILSTFKFTKSDQSNAACVQDKNVKAWNIHTFEIKTFATYCDMPIDGTWSVEFNEGTKINKETIYTNSKLGFSVTLPAGWYAPSSGDDDPHFYNCPGYICEGFEVQANGYNNYTDAIKEAQDNELNPKEIDNLIPGVKIVKSDGYGETWASWYSLFFPEKTFAVGAGDYKNFESGILSTFKPTK